MAKRPVFDAMFYMKSGNLVPVCDLVRLEFDGTTMRWEHKPDTFTGSRAFLLKISMDDIEAVTYSSKGETVEVPDEPATP